MTARDIYFVVRGVQDLFPAFFNFGKYKGEYDHKALSRSICPGSFFPFSYRGFLKESITTQLKMVLLSMGWDLRDIKKINWGSKFT